MTAGAGETRTLTAGYERCRRLHARHGKTYYRAALLLPAWKRRHVYALYGFARYADEIVDDPSSADSVPGKAAALDALGDRLFAGLRGESLDGDPILPAVVHTIRAFAIDHADVEAFLRSMAMDLTVGSYGTYEDLLAYMEGSAAVIGTMMLPILESPDRETAREPARQLGLAFQLTNFIRDVGEDLDRGRVYLPAADLARYGVTRADLAAGVTTPAIRALIAYEAARAREHYRAALPGIDMLVPSSRPCVRAAYELYGGILERIEASGYDVLNRRVQVPRRRRLTTAMRQWVAARPPIRAELRTSPPAPSGHGRQERATRGLDRARQGHTRRDR